MTAAAAIAFLSAFSLHAAPAWPLWDSYAGRFLKEGRIVDHDRSAITTSEGQAYASFFALVANDRDRFERIVRWTSDNLAQGDLAHHLPAWKWGRSDAGKWEVLDPNSASDADMWLAHALIEAGRLWDRNDYRKLGQSIAHRMEQQEVVEIPGLGTALLPGPQGFVHDGVYQLNPSYLPVPVLLALGDAVPGRRWKALAASVPRLLRGSAPKGWVLDWIAYSNRGGFALQPSPAEPLLASYDAIRVYMWAGMMPRQTPHRSACLTALSGMAAYLRNQTFPPSEVAADGTVKNPKSGCGFSAAVVPFLMALGEKQLATANKRRLDDALDVQTGLYGRPAKYYDQNLALFSTGWLEHRFEFSSHGKLQVSWR